MRTIILIILSVLLSACATENNPIAPKEENQITTYFVDHSEEMSEPVQERMITKLRPIVYESLKNAGDKAVIYFITSSSGSNELYGKFTLNEIPLSQHFEEYSEQKQKQELAKRDNKILAEQQYFLAMLKKAIGLSASKEAQKSSDLWATLRIAAESFQAADSGAIKRVVYVSDLLQNSKERSFYHTPPKDDKEAKELGKADVQKILDNYPQIKEGNTLDGIKVHCIQPRELLHGKHRDKAPLMYSYWNAIFTELGASFSME